MEIILGLLILMFALKPKTATSETKKDVAKDTPKKDVAKDTPKKDDTSEKVGVIGASISEAHDINAKPAVRGVGEQLEMHKNLTGDVFATNRVLLVPQHKMFSPPSSPLPRDGFGTTSAPNGRQILNNFSDLFKYTEVFTGLVAAKLSGIALQKTTMLEPFGMIVPTTHIDAFLSPLGENLNRLGGLGTTGWIPCGDLNIYDGKGSVNNWNVPYYTREQVVQTIKNSLPFDATNNVYDVRRLALEAALPDSCDKYFVALKDKNPDALKKLLRGAVDTLGGAAKAAFGAAKAGGDALDAGLKEAEKGLGELIMGLIDAIGRELDARKIQKEYEQKFNRAVIDVLSYLQTPKATWDLLDVVGHENETNGLTAPPYTALFTACAHSPFNIYYGVYPSPLFFMYYSDSTRKIKNNMYSDDCPSSWWTTNPDYK